MSFIVLPRSSVGNPTIKPQRWGPPDAVRYAVRDNCERIGLPMPLCFTPCWGFEFGEYLLNYNILARHTSPLFGEFFEEGVHVTGTTGAFGYIVPAPRATLRNLYSFYSGQNQYSTAGFLAAMPSSSTLRLARLGVGRYRLYGNSAYLGYDCYLDDPESGSSQATWSAGWSSSAYKNAHRISISENNIFRTATTGTFSVSEVPVPENTYFKLNYNGSKHRFFAFWDVYPDDKTDELLHHNPYLLLQPVSRPRYHFLPSVNHWELQIRLNDGEWVDVGNFASDIEEYVKSTGLVSGTYYARIRKFTNGVPSDWENAAPVEFSQVSDDNRVGAASFLAEAIFAAFGQKGTSSPAEFTGTTALPFAGSKEATSPVEFIESSDLVLPGIKGTTGPSALNAAATAGMGGVKQARASIGVLHTSALGATGTKQSISPMNIVGSATTGVSGTKYTQGPSTFLSVAELQLTGLKEIDSVHRSSTATFEAVGSVGIAGTKFTLRGAKFTAETECSAGHSKLATRPAIFTAATTLEASGVKKYSAVEREGAAWFTTPSGTAAGGAKTAHVGTYFSSSAEIGAQGIQGILMPDLANAAGAGTGAHTAAGSVFTNKSGGTLYWVITKSPTKPSVAQIQAGQNHLGAAAPAAGNQEVAAAGAQTIEASGLAELTQYYFHYQHADSLDNQSNVATSQYFRTMDVSIPLAFADEAPCSLIGCQVWGRLDVTNEDITTLWGD